MRILLVEDDSQIAASLRKMLTKATYVVDLVATGEKALFQAETQEYDLLILDWMLPDIEGTEVLKKLRSSGLRVPVLILSAKSQVADMVNGFGIGADDYVSKPFDAALLLARVQALIRRGAAPTASPTLRISDLEVDTKTCTVTRNGKRIELAPKEYALLEYLIMHPCEAIDRMQLLEHVWGETVDEFSNTVDVHIRYLRKKIDEPFAKHLIQTIKQKGYMLCDR